MSVPAFADTLDVQAEIERIAALRTRRRRLMDAWIATADQLLFRIEEFNLVRITALPASLEREVIGLRDALIDMGCRCEHRDLVTVQSAIDHIFDDLMQPALVYKWVVILGLPIEEWPHPSVEDAEVAEGLENPHRVLDARLVAFVRRDGELSHRDLIRMVWDGVARETAQQRLPALVANGQLVLFRRPGPGRGGRPAMWYRLPGSAA